MSFMEYGPILRISTNREVNNFTPKPELEEKGKGALCGVSSNCFRNLWYA